MAVVPEPSDGNPASPVVNRRTMMTVSAAAGLSGLCAAYAAATRPLLRPEVVVDRKPIAVSSAPVLPTKNVEALKYLPDQPWAADAQFIVRNGRSLIFANSWVPVEENSAARIEPFAIVFPPKADAKHQEPLTLVAEAAILRVSGSLEISDLKPGRITGISVPGPVRLRGPEGFDLQGRNFLYDENSQLLWSEDEVTFRHRQNSGSGRGIELQLFRVGDPQSFESVAISGVEAFRLRKNVVMDLQMEGQRGGPFTSISSKDQATSDPNQEPLPTRVTCDGPFVFDMNTNQASFHENVVASRDVPGSRPDSIECDSLDLFFEPATDAAKQAAAERRLKRQAGTLTEDDGLQAIDDELEVKWVVATGQNAMLRSPTNDFSASLSRLAYDAATGVTTLSREGGFVEARQGSSLLVSEQIAIQPVENSSPMVICYGRGRLQHFDPPGSLALEARWAEQLHRMRADNGLDLIRLTGQAQVEQPSESFRLHADGIDLWLDPKENAPGDKSAGLGLAGSSRMEPVRLIAESKAEGDGQGLVMLRSPELVADAKRLDVTFVAPTQPATTAFRESRGNLVLASGQIEQTASERFAAPPAAPPPEEALPTAEPRIQKQAIVTAPPAKPANAQASAAIKNEPPAAAPSPAPVIPIELVAESINVIAERPGERSRDNTSPRRGGEVREVHTTGGVIVSQKRSNGEGPLTIEGDRLDLFNRGEGAELVQIFGREATTAPDGTPIKEKEAWVHDRGADLFGMNINLDRKANRAWVDGRGVLELPAKGAASMLQRGGQDEANAESLQDDPTGEPERLIVWWSEPPNLSPSKDGRPTHGMTFDGDQATFFGHVQTVLGNDQMLCEEMVVRLTERFDFASADRVAGARESARPEIAEVHCKYGVRVAGEVLDENEKLVERRSASFYEFNYDQRTGDTEATGPGMIEIWRRGDGNRASLAADSAVRANVPSERDPTAWEYISVRFNGNSLGNVRHRTTTFHDKVRVVYGPVANEKRVIDPYRPDRFPAEAGWMTCEKLTLTQHAKTESTAAYSDVLAEQNVRIGGRGFEGIADRVTYDESKGQYVLKSFGNRVAMVHYKGPNGSGGGNGQQIDFYPARGKVTVVKAEGFGGLQ